MCNECTTTRTKLEHGDFAWPKLRDLANCRTVPFRTRLTEAFADAYVALIQPGHINLWDSDHRYLQVARIGDAVIGERTRKELKRLKRR